MNQRFGGYLLRRRERQLEGPGGPVDLSARSFDILQVLLSKPGEVIGKDEIFAAVWPGVAVEENTLQVHVSALRKALEPSYIVTVHGRGYKYAGPSPELMGEDKPAPKSDTKPVIAVLPFDNLSGEPDQQYFSDGITGDITDRLARFRVFAVIGQNSAAHFRSAVPDFVAIREVLKADFVITGSVRRAEGRVRIATRLADAASGEAIWAERYDRSLTDLFSLQDEISELIAAAIARYLEIEITVRSSGRPTASLSAYESLLQGLWYFRKLTRAEILVGRAYFIRAVDLDPRSAEALSWLGVAYGEEWLLDFSVANLVKGAELTGRATELDPANALCHAMHGWAQLCLGRLDAAILAGERAVTLNPGHPNVLVNRALIMVYEGRTTEAHMLFHRARSLEPIPPLWFGEFEGVAAFAEKRYEDCLAGVELIPEAGWDMMYALACYGHLGRRDKALEVRKRIEAMGADIDFAVGVNHEPFRDPEPRERLAEGLRIAMSWREA